MDRITPQTAQAIRRLLDAGWRQCEIARELALSPVTVCRIANGTRRACDIEDDPFAELKLAAQRCPGCGGLVYQWPCRTCALRARAERKRAA